MNYTYEEKLYIWLSMVFEMGASAAYKLVNACGSVEKLYQTVICDWHSLESKVKDARAVKLKNLSSMERIDEFINQLESNNIRAVTFKSNEYPQQLKEIYDPPLALYVRGNKKLDSANLPFAVIGTRHCTDYGEHMSKLFAKTFAENGMTIVSGLAYGCDAFVAQGALSCLDSSFPTIAVLGQGVMIDKNDSTSCLVSRIIERGAVVSELLPFNRASKGSYPMRNRIISGMSLGLLVVEAGEKSGTMITANAAMEQGRMIFALPGRITDRMSIGTNYLIRVGAAQAAYDTQDVLDYFNISTSVNAVKNEKSQSDEIADTLVGDAKTIYDLLRKGEKSFDEIADLSGFSAPKLNLHLTELEFSGLIIQLPGRIYSVR